MQRNDLDQGQRAALRRLRRAQLAEARRIRQAVADGYTLTPAQFTSSCRIAVRAEARQVAMHLMRSRLTWPLPPVPWRSPARGSAGCSVAGTTRRCCTASPSLRRGWPAVGRRTLICATWSATLARRSTPRMRARTPCTPAGVPPRQELWRADCQRAALHGRTEDNA